MVAVVKAGAGLGATGPALYGIMGINMGRPGGFLGNMTNIAFRKAAGYMSGAKYSGNVKDCIGCPASEVPTNAVERGLV